MALRDFSLPMIAVLGLGLAGHPQTLYGDTDFRGQKSGSAQSFCRQFPFPFGSVVFWSLCSAFVNRLFSAVSSVECLEFVVRAFLVV